MLTVQYMHGNVIESLRLPLAEAEEYAKALNSKGILCQLVR